MKRCGRSSNRCSLMTSAPLSFSFLRRTRWRGRWKVPRLLGRVLRGLRIEPGPLRSDARGFDRLLHVHLALLLVDQIDVRLRFEAAIGPSIRERIWHSSQQFKDRTDGSVVMTLDVCDDYALRSWILGFGRYVRVVAPSSLAPGSNR